MSFTKGCYVGQETVARLHYKGKPNRHLRGLRLSEPAEHGDPILLGEKEVGTRRLGLRLPHPRADRPGAGAARGEPGRRGVRGGLARPRSPSCRSGRRERAPAPGRPRWAQRGQPPAGRHAHGRSRRRGAARARAGVGSARRRAGPAARGAGGAAGPARPPRADPRARSRPRAGRLGPLRARVRPDRAAAGLLLPLLVPGRGRGRDQRARRGRRAARVQPLRRPASRRADDHAGHPPRAPEPAAAVHARRALVQGLSRAWAC